MNDLGFHVVLFLVASFVIVAVSCMFTESDDRRALRLFPRRYVTFLVGSALVLAVMLALEHTVASVS